MATRRAVLGGVTAASFSLLTGCKPGEKQPAPTTLPSNGIASKTPEGPPVIQLQRPNASLPPAVGTAALAVVRVRADGQPNNARNVMSGVRVSHQEYLTAGHLVLGENGANLMSQCTDIGVGGRTSNGGWAVRDSGLVAPLRDALTDVMWMQTTGEQAGAPVASFAPGPLAVGNTVYFANYRPRPGEDRFDRPIGNMPPLALWDGFALQGHDGSGAGGQNLFSVLTRVGKSYGDFQATEGVEGASGGPVFTANGELLAVSSRHQTRKAADVEEEFGVLIKNGDQRIAPGAEVQVTSVQGVNQALLDTLHAIGEPLRDC